MDIKLNWKLKLDLDISENLPDCRGVGVQVWVRDHVCRKLYSYTAVEFPQRVVQHIVCIRGKPDRHIDVPVQNRVTSGQGRGLRKICHMFSFSVVIHLPTGNFLIILDVFNRVQLPLSRGHQKVKATSRSLLGTSFGGRLFGNDTVAATVLSSKKSGVGWKAKDIFRRGLVFLGPLVTLFPRGMSYFFFPPS